MKLLTLCNDRLALPALNRLLELGVIAGVGISERAGEVQAVVRMLCDKYHVPVRSFRKSTFTAEIKDWVVEFTPAAVLVKTFPWKIPEEVLALPRHGFINFHYAPLPAYRGPNPLFWMLRNGATQGGVSVHRMTAGYDDGPLLLSCDLPLQPGTTFGMLCAQLGFAGLALTDRLLQSLQTGDIKETEQDHAAAAWYGRPTPGDLWIRWNEMDSGQVMRLVNACNPWNKGAPASLNGWMIGFSYVTPLKTGSQEQAAPGTILSIDESSGLCIACAKNTVIRADVVYTEEGFIPGFALAGFGLRPGMVFG